MVNATGFPGSFAQAVEMVRDGGLVIEVGAFVDMGEESFNPAVLCGRNLTMLGIGGEDLLVYEGTLALLARHQASAGFADMVSHRFGVQDAPEAMRTALDAERVGEGAHHRRHDARRVRHPRAHARSSRARAAGSAARSRRGWSEAGCSVALHGRDPETLEQAAAELAGAAEQAGGRVHHVAFDVTDGEAAEAGVAAVEAELGPLDILVNNAGVQHRAPLFEFPEAEWHRIIETNLTSAFLVGRAAARGMVERGRGKIVNIASLQSQIARPGTAPYAASKGGLKMLTRGMCADWGPAGVQVNAIGPGYIDTELTSALVADPEFDAMLRRRTPAARWGRPEELVGALLFLASPASDFVNGQILYVDGGMSAVI